MFLLKVLPTEKILKAYACKFEDLNVSKAARTFQLLQEASFLTKKLENYFSEHELSITRFLILIVLDREQEKTKFSMVELIERIDISKPVMSRTLTTLANSGYIKTGIDPHDRRATLTSITSKGRKKLNAVLPTYYQIINRSKLSEI